MFQTRFVSDQNYDPDISEKIDGWKEAFMYLLLQNYKYKNNANKIPDEVLEFIT